MEKLRLEKVLQGEPVTARQIYMGVRNSKKMANASLKVVRAKCQELADQRPDVFFESDEIWLSNLH